MKEWQDWLRPIIELGIWIGSPTLLIYKGLDAWAKRKMISMRDMEDRVAKLEDNSKRHDEDVSGIKKHAQQMLEMMVSYFKK